MSEEKERRAPSDLLAKKLLGMQRDAVNFEKPKFGNICIWPIPTVVQHGQSAQDTANDVSQFRPPEGCRVEAVPR
jgi:hypothetical protein